MAYFVERSPQEAFVQVPRRGATKDPTDVLTIIHTSI